MRKPGKVQHFMKSAGFKVLTWPPKSLDLNIAEDVWKMLSDAVYDRPPFLNKESLLQKINEVIRDINENKRNVIIKLYAGIRSRLCKVLLRKCGLFNK